VNKESNYSAPTGTSSGFSFLGGSNSATVSGDQKDTTVGTEATTTSSSSPAATDGASSTPDSSNIFSMLNMSSASTPSSSTNQTLPSPSSNNTNTTTTKSSNDDILSLQNPSQPTGSGIVFGGAISKKTKPVIKKRPKKKKVGTGIGADTNPTATAIPTPSDLPTTYSPSHEEYVTGSEHKEDNEPTATSTGEQEKSPSLKTEAEEAASRAEHFMMKKQSEEHNNVPPPHIVSGRYGSSQGVEEDYGDTSSSFVPPAVAQSSQQSTNDDDAYAKAKAAAEEAQQRPPIPKGPAQPGKIGGMFKGFFQTINMVNAKDSANNSLANTSVHSSRGSSNRDRDSPTPLEPSASGVTSKENMEFKVVLKQNEQLNMDKVNEDRRQKDKQAALEEVHERLEKARKDEEERKRVNQLKEQKRQEIENQQRIEAQHAKILQSPEKAFQHILNQFSVKSKGATGRVVELRNERASLIYKRSVAEKQERLATQQISQAESQQIEAIEHEDFELADHLAAVIDRHQKEKDEQSKMLDRIESDIDALDSKRLDVVRHLTLCFVDIQDSLRGFSDDQVAKEADDGNDVMNKFAEGSKRLAVENERLQDDLKHIERDEQYLASEKEDLSKTIEDQTADLEVMKQETSKKLEKVNDEVEELRQKLKEKVAEASLIQTELDNHERSIFVVKNQFSRQLTRLSKKEDNAKEIRSEWESENDVYKKMRASHEEKVSAHSEAMIRHQELKDKVKSEIKTAEGLAKIVTKEVVIEMQGDSHGADNDDLLTMQAEVVKCEASADESNQALMAAKAVIDKLRDEISGIDDLMPKLEKQKKSAAASRDFKAAAKASKEIKEMTARKESCEEDLNGEAAERLQIAQNDLEKCVKQLEEKKSITHEREKKHGVERMSQLVKKIRRLESIKDKLCGKEGDRPTSNSVSSVGAFVLNGEISNLIKEGEVLGQKYGEWETIMSAIKDDESKEDMNTVSSSTPVETTYAKDNKGEAVENDEGEETSKSETVVQEDEGTTVVEKPEITKEDAVKRYKEITLELIEIEKNLHIAVEKEEYEEAAELDGKLDTLKVELQSLDVTSDDIEVNSEVPSTTNGDEESAADEGTSNSDEKSNDTDQQGDSTKNITPESPTDEVEELKNVPLPEPSEEKASDKEQNGDIEEKVENEEIEPQQNGSINEAKECKDDGVPETADEVSP